MVLLGLMGGSEVKNVNLGLVLMKRLHIEGSTLRSISLEYQGNLVEDFSKWGGVEKLMKGHQDIGKEEKAYSDDKLICNVHEVSFHIVLAFRKPGEDFNVEQSRLTSLSPFPFSTMQVFSWKNIKEAHEEMEANKNTGKIVITVD